MSKLLPGYTEQQTQEVLAKMPALKQLVEGSIEVLSGANRDYIEKESLVGRSMEKAGAPGWAVNGFAYVEYLATQAGMLAGRRAEAALADIAGSLLASITKVANATAKSANASRLLTLKVDRNRKRVTSQVDTVIAVDLVSMRNRIAQLAQEIANTSNSTTVIVDPQTPTPPVTILSTTALGLTYGLIVPASLTDRRFKVYMENTGAGPLTLVGGSLLNTFELGAARTVAPAVLATPWLPDVTLPAGGVCYVTPGAPSPSSGLGANEGFNLYLASDKTWAPGELSFIDVVIVD